MACGTLISKQVGRSSSDLAAFYGRDYWFTYLEGEHGQPNITARAQTDLNERCLHWLRAILRYKSPPARVLEIGAAHGGFVAILRWAGFDAIGLEIDPWVVGFARDTFQVPMLLGPIEDQQLEPESFDVIAMFDVLEHLPTPVGTLRRCRELLKPDGALVVQTPKTPARRRHSELVAEDDQFLQQLKPREHLFLFSSRSMRECLHRLGFGALRFEPALFPHYDMFFVASRGPLERVQKSASRRELRATAAGRMILALLDASSRADRCREREEKAVADVAALRRQLGEAETDRAARLAVVEDLGRQLGALEAERNDLNAKVQALRDHLAGVEADRASRLAVIERLGRRLGSTEGERNEWAAKAEALEQHLAGAEADRAARLAVIQEQGQQLGIIRGERDEVSARAGALEQQLRAIEVERAEGIAVIEQQERRLAGLEAENARLIAELQRITESLGYRLMHATKLC